MAPSFISLPIATGREIFSVFAVDGGEAEKLTDLKGELGSYHLSPNGKWIAFSASPERPEVETAKRLKMDFRVIDEDPVDQALYLVPRPPIAAVSDR